jgi:MFS family permease
MVAVFQIPVTRMLARRSFTSQLALGSLLYFVGYGLLGMLDHYAFFFLVIFIVTSGELFMSPPSLTLTSRLAREGKMGRYMGVHGFFTTAGWSLGPMYGGFFLDNLQHNPELAWLLLSSLALVAAAGYALFGKTLPPRFNGTTGSEE